MARRFGCEAPGCDNKHYAVGLCAVHYRRKRTFGDFDLHPRIRGVCSVEGCERPHRSGGLCGLHGRRLRVEGDVGGVAPLKMYGDLRTRWESRVDRNGPVPACRPDLGQCWQWLLKLDRKGYGHLGVNGKTPHAHRVGYELFIGPVPDGLELDHLCRNRACVRPSHLEAVTHKVNVLRGEANAAVNARKTHCINGHPLSGPDAELAPWARPGVRTCLRCHRERKRAPM